MVRKAVMLFVVFVVLISLNGCATTTKKGDLETQGLRNQIQALESQIQEKDQEITSLREALVRKTEAYSASTRQSRESKTLSGEVKSRPTMKYIQIALKNAGYNPGSIDGRKGKQTRDAIKAFQKANGLKADGAAGKQTWALLSGYLEKKEK